MLRLAVTMYFKNQTEFKLQQITVLMLIYSHISKSLCQPRSFSKHHRHVCFNPEKAAKWFLLVPHVCVLAQWRLG